MQSEQHDPFSVKHLLVSLAVLVALPLLHVIAGWATFYFR